MFNNALLMGAAAQGGDSLVSVGNSALYVSGNSEKLTLTTGAGDRTDWAFSTWVYNTNPTAVQGLLHGSAAGAGGTNNDRIFFNSNGALQVAHYDGGAWAGRKYSTALFRDIGWYHVVVIWDSDNGTAGDRLRLYVNGVRLTSFSTDEDLSSGELSFINHDTYVETLGYADGHAIYANIYQAETVFINAASTVSVTDATSFGEFDTTGLFWTPLASATIQELTFGTNGFYLKNSITNAPQLDFQAGDDNTVILSQYKSLLHFDGSDASTTFTDSSSSASNWTANGNAQLDTAQKKFGTASLLLDGTGDYASHATLATVGTQNFTIDLQVRRNGSNTNNAILTWGAAGVDTGLRILTSTDNKLIVSTGNAAVIGTGDHSTSLPDGEFAHVEMVRSGSTLYLFQDGVLLTSKTITYNLSSTSAWWIGDDVVSASPANFNGHIDEVRIAIGYAAHTSGFTAPTSAYSNPPTANNFTNNNSVTTSIHTPTKSWPLLSTLVNQGFPGDTLDLSVGNSKTTYDGSTTTGIALSPIGFPGTGKFVAQVTVDDVASNGIGWVCLNPDGGGMTSSTVFVVNEARWIGLTSGNWIHVEYVNFSGGSNLGTVKTSASDGDVLQLEWDNGTLTVQINGTRYTPSNWTAVDTSKTWTFMSRCPGAGIETWDWGQNGFTPVDASYSYLNTKTLAAATTRTASDTGEYWFNDIYTGTGVSNKRTTGFPVDFSWTKTRGVSSNHCIVDVVRGLDNYLVPNATAAENTITTITDSFDSDGITFGADTASLTNTNTNTMVGWFAKLGGAPTATNSAGAGATPTAGSVKIDGVNLGSALAGTIAATKITANTTLGMSCGTYTGTGSANETIATGLTGCEMIIVKRTDTTYGWAVWHSGLTDDYSVLLQTTAAQVNSGYWDTSGNTSSVIELGTDSEAVNKSGQPYYFMAFAPSQFISIGSYEGNGNANGSFIPTVNSLGIPMQPVWAMTKSIDSTSNWDMYDNKRLGYNVENAQLWANLATAEATADNLDIVTGGLKMRIATDPNVAETYVYMAIGTPIIDTDGRIIAGR